MRHRKPDILLVLTLSVGLGVLVTGYAQKLLYHEPSVVTEKQASKKADFYHAVSGAGKITMGEAKMHQVSN